MCAIYVWMDTSCKKENYKNKKNSSINKSCKNIIMSFSVKILALMRNSIKNNNIKLY